jgi:hypothetical protein
MGMVCHPLWKVALEMGSRLVLDTHESLGPSLGPLVLGVRLYRMVSAQLLWASRGGYEQLLLRASLWQLLSRPFPRSDCGSQRSVAGPSYFARRAEQRSRLSHRKDISLRKTAPCETPRRLILSPELDCGQGSLQEQTEKCE